MINKNNYPEYRQKLSKYIQNEIIPKYAEIKECNLFVFPHYMDKDVELIFKINSNLKDFKELQWNLEMEISNFCENFLEFDYRTKYMIILIEI